MTAQCETLSLACSRRSDSRTRLSVGNELNCTPGKRGEGGGGARESSLPLSPSSLPSFFFFFVNFSPALYFLNAWNRLLYLIINSLRTQTFFFWWEAEYVSRLSCLYARAYLKKCRRLKQNLAVFFNHGHIFFFFFSKCSLRYPARSGFFVPDATGLEKPLLVG